MSEREWLEKWLDKQLRECLQIEESACTRHGMHTANQPQVAPLMPAPLL